MPEVEIVELHHDRKLDKPSGTAARTAELIRERRRSTSTSRSTRSGCPGWSPTRRSSSAARARRSRSATTRSTAARSCPASSSPAARSRPCPDDRLDDRAGERCLRTRRCVERRAGSHGRNCTGGAGPKSARRARWSSSTRRSSGSSRSTPRSTRHPRRSSTRPARPLRARFPTARSGRPVPAQGSRRRLRRQPLHMGSQLLKDAGLPLPGRHLPRLCASATPASSPSARRTRRSSGSCRRPSRDAYGATKNPWDTTRTRRRLERRLRCRGRLRACVPIAHANDGGGSIRIPAAHNGLVGLKPTRQRISEGPLIGDNLSGLTAELVVSKIGPRHRGGSRCSPRWRSRRPLRATAAPRAALRRRARRRERRDSGSPGPPRPTSTPTSTPNASPRSRRPPSCSSRLGHEVVEGSPANLLGDGGGNIDIRDTFLTRWAAGQASLMRQLAMLVGREVDRRRRRAADLGAGRDRPRHATPGATSPTSRSTRA